MQYSPPPLFKQGASARVKVVFFALLAIVFLVVDSHLRSLGLIRQVVGTVLYPLQMVALMPRDAAYRVGDYFSSVATLQSEVKGLRLQQIQNSQTIQQSNQLMAENAQLRKLLAAGERLPVQSVLAEILYDARDAYSRKIVMNRGAQHGVAAGQPVIDDAGVVGQVTRVFPFTSEITLLTDRDQAIPVMNVRNGLRSVAYGRGQSGLLDLRFIATNADIRKGDMLTTSGIDGIYPAGLAVAQVVQVESKSNDAFDRVTCQPLAGINRNKQFLILLAQATPSIYAPPAANPNNGKHGQKNLQGKPDKAAETAKKAAGAAVAPKSPERAR
ncbi:rod shape-determining protein MreC [Herminiimonas sp. CN]|uniref:rod shape-determining protein MreC n=1 Tax=Herminiimonas sp. CN TaxID=1349818 RepID=UPI0004733FE3|nr:rod shape-determining protein MreC [Herminiimonas sp. CN]